MCILNKEQRTLQSVLVVLQLVMTIAFFRLSSRFDAEDEMWKQIAQH